MKRLMEESPEKAKACVYSIQNWISIACFGKQVDEAITSSREFILGRTWNRYEGNEVSFARLLLSADILKYMGNGMACMTSSLP